MDKNILDQYLSKKYPEIKHLVVPPYQEFNIMVRDINYSPMSYAFVVDDVTLATYLLAMNVKISNINMRELRSKSMFLAVREHLTQKQIDKLFEVVCSHENKDMVDVVAQFAQGFQTKNFNFPAAMCDFKDAQWAVSIMDKYKDKWDVHFNSNEALCKAKYPETVEYLISRGADVNARNEEGQTPLEESLESYFFWRTMDHTCSEPVNYEKASPELMASDGHLLNYLNDPELYRPDCNTCIRMTKRMVGVIDAFIQGGSPKPEYDPESLVANYLSR